MGILILFIFVIINVYVLSNDLKNNADQTEQNKTNAVNNNKIAYVSHGLTGTNTRLTSTGQKIYLGLNGNIRNSNGKIMFNYWDEDQRIIQQLVIEECKRLGYEFYPLIFRDPSKRVVKLASNCSAPLVEMETGRTCHIQWRGPIDKYGRVIYDKNVTEKHPFGDYDGSRKESIERPHHVSFLVEKVGREIDLKYGRR